MIRRLTNFLVLLTILLCAVSDAPGCDLTHDWVQLQSTHRTTLSPDLAFLELSLKLRSVLASEGVFLPDVAVIWPDASEADLPVPPLDKAPSAWEIPPEVRAVLATDGIDPSGFWRKKNLPEGENVRLCATLQRMIGGSWHPSHDTPTNRWLLHVSCPERSTNLAWNKDVRTPGMFGLSRLDQAIMRVCLTDPAGKIRLVEEYSLKSLAEAHFTDIASGELKLLGLLVQAGFPPLLRREAVAQPSPDPSLRGECR